ncbi:MAG: fructose-6-phosphate aldolase [Sphingobacteriaceae bacterium]|nr:fructose-6-phosphate aldolase [Sphingobacteriaceae bacterium]
MYLLKTKGIAKIPDYVQLRDEGFTLLAYFRVDRPDKSLEKIGLGDKQAHIMQIINDAPFGEMTVLEL